MVDPNDPVRIFGNAFGKNLFPAIDGGDIFHVNTEERTVARIQAVVSGVILVALILHCDFGNPEHKSRLNLLCTIAITGARVLIVADDGLRTYIRLTKKW